MRILPFADHAKPAFELEERVDISYDYDVKIEEERHALKIAEGFVEQAQFRPVNAKSRVVIKFWKRLTLDFRIDAVCIVSETHEPDVPGRVPSNHAVEPVYEFWPVTRPPLHADDVGALLALSLEI